MPATLVLSALLAAAQAITSTPGPELVLTETKDVAYEAMTDGRTGQAIVTLEARLEEDPGDPATLLNLGTAYARQGQTERAASAFRSALSSGTRYQLELADGRWIDSRYAARLALETLERNTALAALGD